MATSTTKTNKPINPRGLDASPKGYNRAALYSGKALDFDGVNDYVSIGTQSFITASGFSFSAKLYLEDDSEHYIFSTGYNNTNSILLYSPASSNDLVFAWYNTSSGALLSTGVNYTNDEWFDISVNYDGSILTIYKNGVEVVNESFSIPTIASGPYEIGWSSPRAKSTAYLQGKVAGFKIFNTALTAAQVADLYNNPEKIVPTGVEDTALKLWLPMMEGAGTTCYDGSGNGNHGTISGATWTHGIGAPVAQSAVIDWNKGTNGIAYSEDQTNWILQGNTNVTANAVANPFDGLLTADKVYPNTNNVDHYRGIDVGTYSGAVTSSIYVKADGYNFIDFGIYNYTGSVYLVRAVFNLSAESINFVTGSIGDITSIGSGWYRIEITGTLGSSSSIGVYHRIRPNDGTSTYSGDGISGAFLWGGQLVEGSEAGPYVPTFGTAQTSPVLLPQGLTSGRDITGVNLFENVRKQGALNLDGNSWAEVHDNASLDITDAITLECWINSTDKDQYHHIISKNKSGNANYAIITEVTTGYLGFEMISGEFKKTNYNIMDGNWNHIVVTYDETNLKFYINGSLDDTIAYTSAIPTNDVDIHIGARPEGVQLFESDIAQPRIYNRALTAEEVQRNYNAGKNIYTN